MISNWIDFKALRKQLSLEQVLRFYGVEIKLKSGNRHMGFCPLPKHQGKRKSVSFSAKLDHHVWQCFGCKARGNALTFAVIMEGLDPNNPKDFRTVALKLRDAFDLDAGASGKVKPTHEAKKTTPAKLSKPVIINPPLDFELKELDYDHPYLKGRGFLPQTIRRFGLGYCNRGLMKDRIAIPLQDPDGQLVGYGGRLVDDTLLSEDNPRYLLPGRRERADKIIEFRKSLLLYNLHRLARPVTDLIVVESFSATWWLTQWGYLSVVGLIGSDCSDAQAGLIIERTTNDGRVWIFTDADSAGDKCAASVFAGVAAHRWMRRVKGQHAQPTDYTPADLEHIFTDLGATGPKRK